MNKKKSHLNYLCCAPPVLLVLPHEFHLFHLNGGGRGGAAVEDQMEAGISSIVVKKYNMGN